MKKALSLGITVCALAVMMACKSGTEDGSEAVPLVEQEFVDSQRSRGGVEFDRHLLLFGKWKVVAAYRTVDRSDSEKMDTITPNITWSIEKDGYYYETVDSDTYQYGYTITGDTILLREETDGDEPWWTDRWTIDSVSQERMVLSSVDPDKYALSYRWVLQRVSD